MSNRVAAVIAQGKHPVTFRTRKLSSAAPMVLHSGGCGRVGRRRTIFTPKGRPVRGGLSSFPDTGRFRRYLPSQRTGAVPDGTCRFYGYVSFPNTSNTESPCPTPRAGGGTRAFFVVLERGNTSTPAGPCAGFTSSPRSGSAP